MPPANLISFPRYRRIITGVGLILLVISLFNIQLDAGLEVWLALIGLVVLSVWFNVTTPINEKGVTYDLSAIPFLVSAIIINPFGAIILGFIADVSLWVLKPKNQATWKKSWSQFGFNQGMNAISVGVSAFFVTYLHNFFDSNSLLQLVIPWIVAVLVYDQINLFLLIGILKLQGLQSEERVSARAIWFEELWVSAILTFVLILGSIALNYAYTFFGIPGVLVFYIPILSSIYSIKLYKNRVQSYLNELEAKVKIRTQDLEELNLQKSMLLTFLSHDLMTPISSITYVSETLNQDESISSENHELTSLLLRGSRTLQNMISNILDVEKLRVGESISMNLEISIIQQLVYDSVAIMRPEATDKELNIELEMPSEPLLALVDHNQMERVIFNLLSNAIKYSPMGEEILVTVVEENNQVKISVKDNGYGIPTEMQDSIFDMFVRAKSVEHKAMGTGLGLAIARELVRKHKGNLTLEDNNNTGSTFTVSLPLENYDKWISE